MVSSRRYSPLAIAAVIVAIMSAGGVWLAGIGVSREWWSLSGGLRWLALARGAAVLALALVPFAWLQTRPGRRHGRGWAVLAAIVAATGLIVSRSAPSPEALGPAEATTAPDDPPAFAALLPSQISAQTPGTGVTRAVADAGAVDRDDSEVGVRDAVPLAEPLIVTLPPDPAFEQVLAEIADSGWKIVDAEPAEGRIEATRRAPWFGTRDDLAVRVRPEGYGCRIDFRVRARRPGTGVDVERLRELIEDLRDATARS